MWEETESYSSDDNNETKTVAFKLEKKHKSDNQKSNLLVSFLLIAFFSIIALFRITIIGRFIDDTFFSLFFGWMKFPIYLIIIGFCLFIFAGIRFNIKKNFILICFCLFTVLSWLISSCFIIYSFSKGDIKFISNDIFSTIIKDQFYDNWFKGSVYKSNSNIKWYDADLTPDYTGLGGGLFGYLIAGLTSYLTIFGSLILSVFFLFISIVWLLTGNAFYLFYPKHKRKAKKVRVLSLGRNKKGRTKNKKMFAYNRGEEIDNNWNKDVYISRRDSDYAMGNASPFFKNREKKFDSAMNPENYENTRRFDEYIKISESQQKNAENQIYNFNDRAYMQPEKFTNIYELNNKNNFINQPNNFDQHIYNNNFNNPNNINPGFNNQPFFDNNFNQNNNPNSVNDNSNFIRPRRSIENNQNELPKSLYENIDVDKKRKEIKRSTSIRPFEVPDATTVDLLNNNFNKAEDDVYKIDDDNKTSSYFEEFVKSSTITEEYQNIDDIKNKYSFNNPVSVSDIIEDIEEKKIHIVSNYSLPPIDVLEKKVVDQVSIDNSKQYARMQAESVEKLFKRENVEAEVSNVMIGSSIIKLEVSLGERTRSKDILKLEGELKFVLKTSNIFIEAPIEGKSAIGIEFASSNIIAVPFRDAIENIPAQKSYSKLYFPVGKNVNNDWIFADLIETPHLLIAGSTGSGKSVMVNSIICTILMRAKPHEVKMLMIDPKRVELAYYENIPHLLAPVVSDMDQANLVLKKVVDEMERRYDLFNKNNVKHITQYNGIITEKRKKLPYIVVVIDELADLMMSYSKKDIESSIQRLTQMARACGIHLIVATQRPSVDVITGVIKSNIPSRISFAVSSSIDSRTILDQSGGEVLIGKGDMLYSINGISGVKRAQGCFINDNEISDIVNFVKSQGGPPVYDNDFVNLQEPEETASFSAKSSKREKSGPTMKEILEYIYTMGSTSTSEIQKHFSVGYIKASKIIDQLEKDKIVGASGSAPNQKRKVYIK